VQLAFLIDPLASLKPKKDSSLALMVEGARRGHQISVLEFGHESRSRPGNVGGEISDGDPETFVVTFDDHPAPGLAAVTETPDAGVAKHVEYEYTWLLLALTALVLWVALNVRRAP